MAPQFSESDGPGPRRDVVGYGRHVAEGDLARRGARGREHRRSTGRRARSTRKIARRRAQRGPRRDPVRDGPAVPRPRAPSRSTSTAAAPASGACSGCSTSSSIPITFFGAAVAFERNPEVAAWLREAGHEPCCHGWRWEEVWTLSREEEREHMLEAIASIETTCGERPLGWYCRYGPSVNTRELLVEEGGFVYDSDAYNDDLPVLHRGRRASGTSIVPYSFTYNDGRYVLPQGFSDPSSFFDQCRRGLDYLWDEGATHPRMMSIGLHSRWAGQAGRTSGLRDFIEYALEKGDVWFARRIDIAELVERAPRGVRGGGEGGPLPRVRRRGRPAPRGRPRSRAGTGRGGRARAGRRPQPRRRRHAQRHLAAPARAAAHAGLRGGRRHRRGRARA